MKDTNQASEDELRAKILTEFKQVHRLAPADYTENCTNVVMTLVQEYAKQRELALLERLEGQSIRYTADGLDPWAVSVTTIQQEKEKLV